MRLGWRVVDDPSGDSSFVVTWAESNGPTVVQPVRAGFGTTVLRFMPQFELDAEVSLDYAPSGLTWNLACSLDKVSVTKLRPTKKAGLPLVLVVEDDALQAFNMTRCIENAGFAVLGPASSVEKALKLLRQSSCDAAVLDVQLGKETSERVASELAARGIQFLVVSGYSQRQLPVFLAGAPRFAKPLRSEDVVNGLRKCFA